MSDFVQMMKDWRRMCKHYSDESMKDGSHSCVDMCPLGHNTACGIIEDALDSDIEVMAKEVAKWAAEHPVVYPTWGEWLSEQAVVIKTIDNGALIYEPDAKMRQHIPDDMAEKLGIEPKEG